MSIKELLLNEEFAKSFPVVAHGLREVLKEKALSPPGDCTLEQIGQRLTYFKEVIEILDDIGDSILRKPAQRSRKRLKTSLFEQEKAPTK